MAGILIYTASGDSEGTMGGLVRQGRPDTFPKMFKKAIEASMTCSNDPVCSLSLGQGRDSLNMAACYSCTLIPETSCEEFNVFLDRGVVVGTFNSQNIAFFKEQLYGENKWAADTEYFRPTVEGQNQTGSIGLIPGVGTDLTAMAYSEIWNMLLQWAEDNETACIEALKNRSSDFAGIEKPLYDCEFMISGDPEKHTCDLLWKDAKVALFTEINQDDYQLTANSTWNCFTTTDPEFSPNKLLAALKEQ